MMPVALLAQGRLYDPDATAHFARASGVSYTEQEKLNLNELILGLKEDEIWDLLDVLVVPKTTQANSAMNLCSSNFDGVLHNVGFTANQGFQTAGSVSSYIDTQYVFGGAGSQATLNSSMMGCYIRNSATYSGSAKHLMGWADTVGGDYTSSKISFSGLTAAGLSLAMNSDGITHSNVIVRPFFALSRIDSTTILLNINGTTDSIASNSVALSPDMAVWIGQTNAGTGPIANQFASWFMGSEFSDPQLVSLYNRIQAYMTLIGAEV